MPIGLEGHTVSLTKNGYFKLIELVQKYPSNQILNHLDEIKLDHTQARKMLAGNDRNLLPNVWDTIKTFDQEAQYALLLFSIIFSHKDLIEIFKSSINGEMRGSIVRPSPTDKTYTNLAYALNQAGLAIKFKEGAIKTDFDLSPIFTNNEIGPLAKIVLKAHLNNMGWNDPTVNQPFQRTFEEQIEYYEFQKVFGISSIQFHEWLDGKNLSQSSSLTPLLNPQDLITQFKESIEGSGLQFEASVLLRFIASLQTKPFVILTGLTGSGKTKLAQSFVQWICETENQYRIIPVGADWTNREPLLGYPNGLTQDEYVHPDSGALNLILKSIADPEHPYFIILDEMNLSHVERYFADFLSVMESNDSLKLYSGKSRKNSEQPIPEKIHWPKNLFIVGTVNIDESTYMFSPKVLDRANVIEFRVSHDEMESFIEKQTTVKLEFLEGKGVPLAQGFLGLTQMKTPDSVMVNFKEELIKIFDELKTLGAEFGYRSASEIARLVFSLGVLDNDIENDQKIDIAIIQKMLPKLHGSRSKLLPVLAKLGQLCLKEDLKWSACIENRDGSGIEWSKVKYALSFEKILRMHWNAFDNGFASYAEA